MSVIEDKLRYLEPLQLEAGSHDAPDNGLVHACGIGAGVIRDGEPEFDDLDGPIIYQGSHVLPSATDPRGGSVSLALIDREEDAAPWPWLRLDVEAHDSTYGGGAYATVVLTKHQATRLRDALSEWIEEAA